MGAKRRECALLHRGRRALAGYSEVRGRKREDRKRQEDVGAMLPRKGVGVGRRVRAGFVLVLRFSRLQTPGRQRNRGRGAATGGSVAEEPDGHRFIQVCFSFCAMTENHSSPQVAPVRFKLKSGGESFRCARPCE